MREGRLESCQEMHRKIIQKADCVREANGSSCEHFGRITYIHPIWGYTWNFLFERVTEFFYKFKLYKKTCSHLKEEDGHCAMMCPLLRRGGRSVSGDHFQSALRNQSDFHGNRVGPISSKFWKLNERFWKTYFLMKETFFNLLSNIIWISESITFYYWKTFLTWKSPIILKQNNNTTAQANWIIFFIDLLIREVLPAFVYPTTATVGLPWATVLSFLRWSSTSSRSRFRSCCSRRRSSSTLKLRFELRRNIWGTMWGWYNGFLDATEKDTQARFKRTFVKTCEGDELSFIGEIG